MLSILRRIPRTPARVLLGAIRATYTAASSGFRFGTASAVRLAPRARRRLDTDFAAESVSRRRRGGPHDLPEGVVVDDHPIHEGGGAAPTRGMGIFFAPVYVFFAAVGALLVFTLEAVLVVYTALWWLSRLVLLAVAACSAAGQMAIVFGIVFGTALSISNMSASSSSATACRQCPDLECVWFKGSLPVQYPEAAALTAVVISDAVQKKCVARAEPSGTIRTCRAVGIFRQCVTDTDASFFKTPDGDNDGEECPVCAWPVCGKVHVDVHPPIGVITPDEAPQLLSFFISRGLSQKCFDHAAGSNGIETCVGVEKYRRCTGAPHRMAEPVSPMFSGEGDDGGDDFDGENELGLHGCDGEAENGDSDW